MNVPKKTLIKELKKYPSNLDVKYAHGDNSEWEAAGEVVGMMLFEKEEIRDDVPESSEDQSMFDSMPDSCVILRG